MKLLLVLLIVFILISAAWTTGQSARISEIHKIREALHNHKKLLKKTKDKLPDEYFNGYEEAENLLNEIEEEEKDEKLL